MTATSPSIDCLYSPYSARRSSEGGFCEPGRILLTVLRAWPNTRSIESAMMKYVVISWLLWSYRRDVVIV